MASRCPLVAFEAKAGQEGMVAKGRQITLGIDLGTTNTVIARNAEAFPFEEDGHLEHTMPSVVAYPPNGVRDVGRKARWRRAIDPVNTIASSKRVIGIRWGSSAAKRYAEMCPYELVQSEAQVGFKTRDGVKTPINIGETIVREICERSNVDRQGVRAVVSVPVAFEQERREATLQAVRRVGFGEVAVIDEPVATALAYLNRCSLKHAVVYDLGGGTFDVAVVDCGNYPFTVVGHAGDPYLGGDDVDRLIAQQVARRVLERSGWDLKDNDETFAKLVFHCENAKISLSDVDHIPLLIAEVDPAAPRKCGEESVSREELHTLTLDLVRRSFVMCDAALADAGIVARDVDAVFLAGGSTQLPGLHEFVAQYFGKQPRFDLPPMHVVAMGASLAAARPGVSELLDFNVG